MNNISHIDHIAIAVRKIEDIMDFYEQSLGLKIDNVEEMPKRGIRVAFISIGATKIELIEPLSDNSEVSKFLDQRGPGIHHIALKSNNIEELSEKFAEKNTRLVYEKAQPGAHNTKVNFIHPKQTQGVLFEIVEHEK